MLVLSRKWREAVIINGTIRVQVVELSDGKVKLGFESPPGVTIDREEIHLRRLQERANEPQTQEAK